MLTAKESEAAYLQHKATKKEILAKRSYYVGVAGFIVGILGIIIGCII